MVIEHSFMNKSYTAKKKKKKKKNIYIYIYIYICKLMRCSCNKVSDPLKAQHTLDCIAASTNYLNIYSHIYV